MRAESTVICTWLGLAFVAETATGLTLITVDIGGLPSWRRPYLSSQMRLLRLDVTVLTAATRQAGRIHRSSFVGRGERTPGCGAAFF